MLDLRMARTQDAAVPGDQARAAALRAAARARRGGRPRYALAQEGEEAFQYATETTM